MALHWVIAFLLPAAVVVLVELVKVVAHVVRLVAEEQVVHHLLQVERELLVARMVVVVAEQALLLADLVVALLTMLAQAVTALITLVVAAAAAAATLAVVAVVAALSQADLVRQEAQVVTVVQPLAEPVVLEHLQVTPIILAQAAVAVAAHRMLEASAQAVSPMQAKLVMVKSSLPCQKQPLLMLERRQEQSQSVALLKRPTYKQPLLILPLRLVKLWHLAHRL
jgi:hypothetical protein